MADAIGILPTHNPATAAIAWAETLTDKPVFLVLGNHEFYSNVMVEELASARSPAAHTRHVTILDNDAVAFNGIRVLGCTLWTDFLLFGVDWRLASARTVELGMNDYQRIKRLGDTSGRRYRLRALDTLDLHRTSRRFLEDELGKHRPTGSAAGESSEAPVIVITHHAPLPGAVAPGSGTI